LIFCGLQHFVYSPFVATLEALAMTGVALLVAGTRDRN
jgi:hypothetical protein